MVHISVEDTILYVKYFNKNNLTYNGPLSDRRCQDYAYFIGHVQAADKVLVVKCHLGIEKSANITATAIDNMLIVC